MEFWRISSEPCAIPSRKTVGWSFAHAWFPPEKKGSEKEHQHTQTDWNFQNCGVLGVSQVHTQAKDTSGQATLSLCDSYSPLSLELTSHPCDLEIL